MNKWMKTVSILVVVIIAGGCGTVHKHTHREAPDRDPNIETCFERVHTGRFSEALPVCAEAVRAHPDNFIVHASYARALAETGQTEKAEKVYYHALDIDPEAVSTRMELGILLTNSGKHTAALDTFQEVIYRRPEFAQGYIEMAQVHRMLKNWGPAADMFDRAAGIQPQDEGLRTDLVQALLRAGRFVQARNTVRNATNDFPGSADLAFSFGVLLQEHRNYQDAVTQYNRVLQLDPGHDSARYNMALCHFQNRNIREAERAVTALLQRRPDSSPALVLAGQIASSSNNHSDAERFFRKAVELDASNGNAWVLLGNVLRRRNDRSGAAEAYRQALRINPNDETARENLRRVY